MNELLKVYVQKNKNVPIRQLRRLDKNLLKTYFYSNSNFIFNKLISESFIDTSVHGLNYFTVLYDIISDKEIKMYIDYLKDYEYINDDDDELIDDEDEDGEDVNKREAYITWGAFRAGMLEKLYKKIGLEELKNTILEHLNHKSSSDKVILYDITIHPTKILNLNNFSHFLRKYDKFLNYFTDDFLVRIYAHFINYRNSSFLSNKLHDISDKIGMDNLNNYIVKIFDGEKLDADGIEVEFLFDFKKLYNNKTKHDELKNLYEKYKNIMNDEDIKKLSLSLKEYRSGMLVGLIPFKILDKFNDLGTLESDKLYQYLPIEYVEYKNLWDKFDNALKIITIDIFRIAEYKAKTSYRFKFFNGVPTISIKSQNVIVPKEYVMEKIEEEYEYLKISFGKIYSVRHLEYLRDKLYEFVDYIYNYDIKL
jgi:hypothetical protein